jgi:hypothetical protein
MKLLEMISQLSPQENVKVWLPSGEVTVAIRRLSALELLSLPDERSQIGLVAAAVLNEDGSKAFESPAKVESLPWQVVGALARAAAKVNSPVTVEDAAKK